MWRGACLGVDAQLLDSARTEGVARTEHGREAVRAQVVRHLGERRGLAYAVHTHEDDHVRPLLRLCRTGAPRRRCIRTRGQSHRGEEGGAYVTCHTQRHIWRHAVARRYARAHLGGVDFREKINALGGGEDAGEGLLHGGADGGGERGEGAQLLALE